MHNWTAVITSRAARLSLQASHGHVQRWRAKPTKRCSSGGCQGFLCKNPSGRCYQSQHSMSRHFPKTDTISMFRGGTVRRAESGRAGHFTAVTVTIVVPEVDIEGNPHKRGPGTGGYLSRRCGLSTAGLAINCSGRLKLGLQRQPRHQNRFPLVPTSMV